MGSNRNCSRSKVDSLAVSIGLRRYTLCFKNAMQTGTIARLTDGGYGFISRDGEEKDLFFHSKELQGANFDELNEGQKVQFEVGEGPKGPNAVNVSLVTE